MRYLLSRTVSLSLLCWACSAGQWQSADDTIQPGKPPVYLGRPLVENPLFANANGKYGYTTTNPIRLAGLGGITPQTAVLYFRRLRGPQKQPVRYRRVGTCCDFATPNGVFGPKGILDAYEVTYAGLSQPVVVYVNIYDPGEILAPEGFMLVD